MKTLTYAQSLAYILANGYNVSDLLWMSKESNPIQSINGALTHIDLTAYKAVYDASYYRVEGSFNPIYRTHDEIVALLLPKKVIIMKHSNINKQALKLAHSIKQAYKSFRSALLVAYKVLKDTHAKQNILNGLAMAQVKLSVLGNKKWIAVSNAWLAIYTLDYLD